MLVTLAGVVSETLSAGQRATLLLYVWPVCTPVGPIGERLLGWLIALAFCVPASLFLLPPLGPTVPAPGRGQTERNNMADLHRQRRRPSRWCGARTRGALSHLYRVEYRSGRIGKLPRLGTAVEFATLVQAQQHAQQMCDDMAGLELPDENEEQP